VDPAALVARPAYGEALGAVVERLIAHADALYARAYVGIATLPSDCRSSIYAARLIYSEIGRAVARGGYDSVSRRAVVPLRTKLWLLVKALVWAGTSGQAEELGDTPSRQGIYAPPLEETRFLVDAAAGRAGRGADAARLLGGVAA
jgi:phytoene synthase